jgi:ribosomal protein L15E
VVDLYRVYNVASTRKSLIYKGKVIKKRVDKLLYFRQDGLAFSERRKQMSLNQYVEKLEEAGIADTRTYSLNHGMEVLWSAYVMLDSSARQSFNEFVGDRTVREALIQWAKTQPGNNSRL